ncbi:hypothetical protein KCP69_09825 [Salmonella enterica subsp. enterica]|nr:hypothetical protein KCP69_09825 [Salmonella enterica subsp. enterica]
MRALGRYKKPLTVLITTRFILHLNGKRRSADPMRRVKIDGPGINRSR